MSPSEYQELTTFFVDQLGRHHRETRAFVVEQLNLYREEIRTFVVEQLDLFRQEIRAFVIEQSRETRSFAGVSAESLRHEIRLVADGVLTNSRLIEEANRRIDDNSARLADNSARIGEQSARIDTLTERVAGVETTMSTRFTDHEDRLRVLE